MRQTPVRRARLTVEPPRPSGTPDRGPAGSEESRPQEPQCCGALRERRCGSAPRRLRALRMPVRRARSGPCWQTRCGQPRTWGPGELRGWGTGCAAPGASRATAMPSTTSRGCGCGRGCREAGRSGRGCRPRSETWRLPPPRGYGRPGRGDRRPPEARRGRRCDGASAGHRAPVAPEAPALASAVRHDRQAAPAWWRGAAARPGTPGLLAAGYRK